MDTFKSLKTHQVIENNVKKSRFIAIAFPCDDVEVFEKELDRIQRKYPGARHYCYGYRIQEQCVNERYQDDHEPSGTAGLPILEVLRHHDLLQCGIVVVRYFGGTLLGTGGLTRAYSDAARDAVVAATLVEHVEACEIDVVCDYHISGKVEYYLKTNQVTVIDTEYTHQVVYQILIEKKKVNQVEKELMALVGGQIRFEKSVDVTGIRENGQLSLWH